MKVVSKSVLDEFLDGFREWRAKKSKDKVDNDDNFQYWFHRFVHHFINIFMAIFMGIMRVVMAFLRPLPFIAILFMAYVFFLLGQYKDAQEIEANAINPQPQVEQTSPQSMSTEINDMKATIERAKILIEEIEASGRRQDRDLEIIKTFLEEHGEIIE